MKMVDHLINDLMDLAKMDNEQFKINQSYFNMVGTLHGSLMILKDNANLRDVKLKVSIDHKQHLVFLEHIKGDENRLQQIFLNFLSNSFKFTNAGGTVEIFIKLLHLQPVKTKFEKDRIKEQIRSSLEFEEEDELERRESPVLDSSYSAISLGELFNKKQYVGLSISIKDNGCGISQEGIGQLFMDFGKLQDTHARN